MQFGKSGKIDGAVTTQYLLEKSRVVQPGPNERSYHIFYQLLVGADAEIAKELQLDTADNFRTLNAGGRIEADGVDDSEGWNATQRGMRNLKFDAKYMDSMNRILAGILHCGNIVFVKNGDGAKVMEMDPVTKAAATLKVSDTALLDALVMKHVTVRNQTTKSPYTLLQAQEARDALCKALYAQMFKDVVVQINKTLACKDNRIRSVIGILDIFGFEIFQSNSLEQLFINYANEKLHQIFNSFVFKQEQADYREEGIPVEEVGFRDNKDVLDLIEAKKGLLDYLNDEVGLPKGSDENYMTRISQEHKKHTNYKNDRKNKSLFIVSHFAGEVTYETKGFLEKNRDKLPEAITSLMTSSKVSIIPGLFAEEADSSRARKTPPLAKQFQASLKSLSDTINKTEPHFVRCIKPNQSKQANDFQADLTLEQLRNCGVLETVQIRALGFPNRLVHKEFFHKYSCAVDKKLVASWKTQNLGTRCKNLIAEMVKDANGLAAKEIATGKSKVFWRQSQSPILTEMRAQGLKASVITIQSLVKGWLVRRMYKQMRRVHQKCVDSILGRKVEHMESALEELEEQTFDLFVQYELQDLLELLQQSAFVGRKLQGVVDTEDTAEMDNVMKEAMAYLDRTKKMAQNKVPPTAIMQDGVIFKEIIEGLEAQVAQVQSRKAKVEADKRAAEEARKAALLAAKTPVVAVTPKPAATATSAPKVAAVVKPTIPVDSKAGSGKAVAKAASLKPVIRPENMVPCRVCLVGLTEENDPKRCLRCEFLVCSPHSLNEAKWKPPGGLPGTVASFCDYCVSQKPGDATRNCHVCGEHQKLRQCKQCLRTCCVPCSSNIKSVFMLLPSPVGNSVKVSKGFVCEPCYLEVAKSKMMHFVQSDRCATCHTHMANQLSRSCGSCDRQVCFACSEHVKQVHDRVAQHVCLDCFKGKNPKVAPGKPSSRKPQSAAEAYEMFLEMYTGMYPLSDFKGLRRDREWAKSIRDANSKRLTMVSMCVWQMAPLPSSLFKLTSMYCKTPGRARDCDRMAVSLFYNIQVYMRDRFHNLPAPLGYEVVKTGFQEPLLRDEIYMQLIKQTTNNPDPESNIFGWRLIFGCLTAFLPHKLMSNVLLAHVAANARKGYCHPDALSFETVEDIAFKSYWQFRKTFKKGSGTLMSLKVFTMKAHERKDGDASQANAGRGAPSSSVVPDENTQMSISRQQQPAVTAARPSSSPLRPAAAAPQPSPEQPGATSAPELSGKPIVRTPVGKVILNNSAQESPAPVSPGAMSTPGAVNKQIILTPSKEGEREMAPQNRKISATFNEMLDNFLGMVEDEEEDEAPSPPINVAGAESGEEEEDMPPPVPEYRPATRFSIAEESDDDEAPPVPV
eukprot:gb/GEZN01000379.1/.p1 GENE.gb/GEZN01000379.1/~~gb/GEZN01000379.1/.p1  ORF type:complete len:1532 (+),score=209.09 gb/GEZN01000379.1/:513-4598(+)